MARLILVSNRLPFTLRETQGKPEFEVSSGGLVTAMSSYLRGQIQDPEFECLWVGWPGAYLPVSQQDSLNQKALKEHSAVPVWLDPSEADLFYHGFSNKTLWPLFHYLPSFTHFDESAWYAYQKANLHFRDALLSLIQPDDTIWIHDYQLLLLPGLIRAAFPKNPIGFFLHIPFPSFELFRLLPSQWRKEILEGMLGADLIGFHTHDYTQYFLRSVSRTLGYEHALGSVAIGDRIVKADTFPLGIDYEKFHSAITLAEVEEEKNILTTKLQGVKIVSSVDRLDYTKGILHRLKGFEFFLENYPDWCGKVVLVLVVVPSRENVDRYQKMKREIDEAIGKINGAFGDTRWTPVLYQYRSVGFHSLVALYSLSDVALITPLRDGMNLVSKEFLACQGDEGGVLILSEMAGAARELGEALIINPFHRREIAVALQQALSMSKDEQIRRLHPMQERLRKHDAKHWASTFQKSLVEIVSLQLRLNAKHLGEKPLQSMIHKYRQSVQRLILLDYDGTLIPFAPYPHQAKPDPKLLELLSRLQADPDNQIYLISGRQKENLTNWFGSLGIGMIAEHGVWMSEPNQEWKLPKHLSVAWKNKLLPILEDYTSRLSGSLVEIKEFSIAWHYRNADVDLGAQRAKELVDTLVHFTANYDVQVLEGKKVVELRAAGVSKGTAAIAVRNALQPDFILAIGDDQTDEDLFRALSLDAHTIRVGMKPSYADYNLRDYQEVRRLLGTFDTESRDLLHKRLSHEKG